MSETGGWVFLSHSHLDIDIVRQIRNKLEKMGFNPLTFYLKCLNDDDEIEELIKREIREREWFIFVNSRNARNSRWVETERDYIEEIGGKNVCVINTNSAETEIDQILNHLADHMLINIVYSENDHLYAEQAEQILLLHDFSVRRIGLNVPLQDPSQIREIMENGNGFFMFILTEQNIPSLSCLAELDAISLQDRHVILAMEEEMDCLSTGMAIFQLAGSFVVKEMDADQKERFYKAIRSLIKWNYHDFTTSDGFLSARIIHYPEIEAINDYAFSDCSALEEVYIPDSVVYISVKAFEGKEGVLVHCSEGSHAEHFCRIHHFRYTLQ